MVVRRDVVRFKGSADMLCTMLTNRVSLRVVGQASLHLLACVDRDISAYLDSIVQT
jgi:hypothetical protein